MTSTTAPVYDVPTVARLFGFPEMQGAPAYSQLIAPMPGFVAFWDPGWSLFALWVVLNSRGIFSPEEWLANEPRAWKDEAPCFRRLRMEPFRGSYGKTFDEQVALLPAGEQVPPARVVVAGVA